MAGFTTALTLGMIGVSTATQVIGQIKAGNAARRAGEAERRASESVASLHDYNADVADLQAADAIARGTIDENQFRQQVRGLIGRQRADIAASGVDVGFGSAVDVQADAAHLGELDALQIRQNARREAWGYKVQAVDYRRRADIARREGVFLEAAGRAQQGASRVAAVGTIASGGVGLLQARYGF